MIRLQEKKIRLTPQRAEVFELLHLPGVHLSAEEIYNGVRKKLPYISFATVYAILQSFKKHSLVQEIRIMYGKSLFEARMDPHHHFFCRKCRCVFNVDHGPCPQLVKKSSQWHSIESFQGYFYGVCKNCANKD
jgi:Fe2+ or Zn2+ uptake regulation protein